MPVQSVRLALRFGAGAFVSATSAMVRSGGSPIAARHGTHPAGLAPIWRAVNGRLKRVDSSAAS
jgi:hypothetical protein